MTGEQNSSCHKIIHTAATSAGAIGAGLAQLPMSDSLAIMPIQIAMIASLGKVFGRDLSETTIKSLLGAAAATVAGRTASQVLLGWIPIFGNALNASTAFGITEAIGWKIANDFDKDSSSELGL